MPTKESFKEPIVRTRVSRIRFPKICPVCGEEATTIVRVETTPFITNYIGTSASSLGRTPYERKRLGIKLPESKTFLVQACEDHQIADEGILRFRTATSFWAILAICMLIFAIMFIGGDLWLNRPLSPWAIPFFTFFTISMIMAVIAFRPGPMESAFKVIGFDFDIRYVWIQLKNREYRDAFIEENLPECDLVSWIVRG